MATVIHAQTSLSLLELRSHDTDMQTEPYCAYDNPINTRALSHIAMLIRYLLMMSSHPAYSYAHSQIVFCSVVKHTHCGTCMLQWQVAVCCNCPASYAIDCGLLLPALAEQSSVALPVLSFMPASHCLPHSIVLGHC